ncbi:GntR family transcriptional regulator [Streptosporangium sp. NPDC001559]|uniref:GntR family transcriptional regulator n=1 Tax=Streptosporangium sp. NPDC001559 TaxID=3366187 RepID=UPI0036F17611
MSDADVVPAPYVALTKTEVAYKLIRKDIVEGVLQPDAILDQEALATKLGLSTTPVREALRLLESENLVISRRHRNTVVSPLDLGQLKETYAVRILLDPKAVALGAEVATQEQRDEIAELLVLSERDQTPIEGLHSNRALHRAIYSSCGNSVLVQILENLWDRCDRYRVATLRDKAQVKVANDEHRRIVDAFIAGRSEEAAQLMLEHISASFDRIDHSALGLDD